MVVRREGTGAGGSTGSGFTPALTLMVQHSPAAGPARGLVLGQERERTPRANLMAPGRPGRWRSTLVPPRPHPDKDPRPSRR